ncbi:ATP-dependent DNA ligase [Diaminobutyricibacter sp. McL0608]|uniref:DUF7882 family protein n=1 Tax=Leifsonia sp. McL0608 TaxID=3143537 RepID=UPI0031F31CD9
MGTLTYGTGLCFGFDDRTLAHLQIVMGLKLRRREGFFFSWIDPVRLGEGRLSVWIDPSIPLAFRFDNGDAVVIDREWLEAMSDQSNSAAGLRVSCKAIDPARREAVAEPTIASV